MSQKCEWCGEGANEEQGPVETYPAAAFHADCEFRAGFTGFCSTCGKDSFLHVVECKANDAFQRGYARGNAGDPFRDL